ncbi:MAG: sigma-54 dependent transcriptional regulator [Desulfobacterales bacterium]|nr:sigma-54 dependent transcriptional regulator [Desulfobacterales bacterium]
MKPPSTCNPLRLAVIDDEPLALKQLRRILSRRGYAVEVFDDPVAALKHIDQAHVDIVLTDLRMPRVGGMDVLRHVKARQPQAEVILITGYASIDDAVAAVKQGAFYYIEKPISPDQLLSVIQRAADKISLQAINAQLKEELMKKEPARDILGVSPQIRELVKVIAKVARIDCNVLIQGESGTGKELVARAIHLGSERREHPFVGFNCGGFAEELVASELFGHEKGAFTGAHSLKPGLFEQAQGGTVFLDEVGEMSLSTQVKLLRLIQERKVQRVGGSKAVPLDFRLISATNKDLEREVGAGRFREDLFFRLKVVVIRTPPLRERPEDIPVFMDYFLNLYNLRYNKAIQGFSPEARDTLLSYSFPGNVRELEHIVCSAVALSETDIIDVADLPEDLQVLEVDAVACNELSTLEQTEKAHIVRVLEATNYSKVRAAEILGIPRTTLWRKIRKYGIREIR